MTGSPETDAEPGRELELDVGPVGYGGQCVARHDGRVLLVRHALPGERVIARVTGVGRRGRFLRADAVRVLAASPDRVTPPCPYAGPGRCGGCDWQHAALDAQRRLKGRVLADALRRHAGVSEVGGQALPESVEVHAVPGDEDGLRWRTRVRYAVAPHNEGPPALGFRRHRSHEVEPVGDCRIAAREIAALPLADHPWPHTVAEVAMTRSGTGELVVRPEPASTRDPELLRLLPAAVSVPGVRGRGRVTEQAAGRRWRVSGDGFWQVHPGGAEVLVDAVRALLAPRPGEHLLDLYSGVGLFAGALAADLGPGGRVDAVEGSAAAAKDARRNLHDLPQVHLHHADVRVWLRRRSVVRADLVVLDPPRTGAGPDVVRQLLARGPRAIAYVACDPVALARDLAVALAAGWRLAQLRAYDLFPMTHHLETVALLLPARSG